MFDDQVAKKLFVRLVQEIEENEFYWNVFRRLIHEKFDEKIVSLEDLDTFYLTESDVKECWVKTMEIKEKSHD